MDLWNSSAEIPPRAKRSLRISFAEAPFSVTLL
jgi:hypothetical protein